MTERNEQLKAAQAELSDALQRMASIIGPRLCEHGDHGECDVCDYDDTKPVEDAMLSEFVLVMTWTKMGDGESFYGVHTPPNQLFTHTNGLLHTALYDM
jgi:hypothetical protein